MNDPLLTKDALYRKLKKEAGKKLWKIGSKKSFYRQMKQYPEIRTLRVKAIEGDRGVNNKISPYIKRDLDILPSMDMIVGDQLLFDFYVHDDDGRIISPQGYIFLDMGSSFICGVDIVLGNYNKKTIANSLKQSLEYGLPNAIYTDNGKPELSKYIEDLRYQIAGIAFKGFDDLKYVQTKQGGKVITHTKAKPRNSRAKPIESVFGHLQKRLYEETKGFGYHKYSKTETDEYVKQIMKKALKQGRILHYKDFFKCFANVCQWWNEHTISTRGIVPKEAFFKKCNGLVRLSDETLDLLFMERKEVKVRNSYIMHKEKGVEYTYHHTNLVHYSNSRVEARYSECKNYIEVLDIDTLAPVCRAHRIDAIDPRDQAALKAGLERQDNITRAVRDAFKHYKSLYKPATLINPVSYSAMLIKKRKKEEIANNRISYKSNEEFLKVM